MLEMLIILGCMSEIECNTLTKAYLSHNQELKINIKETGKKISKLAGKEFTVLTAVGYGGIVRKKLRTRLPYNCMLEWKADKEVDLTWRYDF